MSRAPKPWYRKDRKAWFVTIGGARHKLGTTKKEAMDEFYRLMNVPKTISRATSKAFPSIADLFLEWVKNNRSPDTFEWYRYRIERFCQRYPKLNALNIKPFHVQEWVDSYDGLSKTSKRNYIRSIKRCMAWSVQQGYIDSNPIVSLEVPGADRREVTLTSEEFETMMDSIPDQSLKDLCTVAFETGCRPQELLRVEARHVDAKNERWIFPVDESKGKRAPRIVYLTPKVLSLTTSLVTKYPTGKLFRNSEGIPWTVSAVNCGFKRLQHRMGKAVVNAKSLVLATLLAEEIAADPESRKLKPDKLTIGERRKLSNRVYCRFAPKYSLYALRHAWATRALQSGTDSLTVAILMGHKDPSTLSRVYQHLSHNPTHLSEQAKRATGK